MKIGSSSPVLAMLKRDISDTAALKVIRALVISALGESTFFSLDVYFVVHM